jgi:hypothetical protein
MRKGLAFLAMFAVSACHADTGTALTGESAAQQSDKKLGAKAMILEQPSEDRLPAPDVPAQTRDGVIYEQAEDGRSVGAAQECGVLIARDATTGAQLWTLVVYANPIDPKMETDAQLIYFTSMAFDADGRLRITNEAGKSFLVDVTKRTVTPGS